MICTLYNSIASMLDFLILINVLWQYNRKSLILGYQLKYLWLKMYVCKLLSKLSEKNFVYVCIEREKGEPMVNYKRQSIKLVNRDKGHTGIICTILTTFL